MNRLLQSILLSIAIGVVGFLFWWPLILVSWRYWHG